MSEMGEIARKALQKALDVSGALEEVTAERDEAIRTRETLNTLYRTQLDIVQEQARDIHGLRRELDNQKVLRDEQFKALAIWRSVAMGAKEALEKLSKEDYCGHYCSDCCVESANEIAKAALAAYPKEGE